MTPTTQHRRMYCSARCGFTAHVRATAPGDGLWTCIECQRRHALSRTKSTTGAPEPTAQEVEVDRLVGSYTAADLAVQLYACTLRVHELQAKLDAPPSRPRRRRPG